MSGQETSAQTQFFFELTPERVLDAVEASGLRPTGRCMALNSFENRVYDVELEEPDDEPATTKPELAPISPAHSSNRRVFKFYRPGRWSREQILEEHRFLADLVAAEIPAVAPALFPNGETLHQMDVGGIWYSFFPKVGGRAPDELADSQLNWIGRLLGRIHTVGAASPAPNRVRIGPETYGRANLKFLLDSGLIPLEYQARYTSVVEKICDISQPWFDEANRSSHRLHGDCHLGNLLINRVGPFFVDFDDMVVGPAVQDLWLLLPARPGEDPQARRQLELLLEGYEEMRPFDRTTLRLIEPLRALRFVHYTAWVARRWKDPAFPLAFPEFGTHRYWADETQDLENQLRMILSRDGA